MLQCMVLDVYWFCGLSPCGGPTLTVLVRGFFLFWATLIKDTLFKKLQNLARVVSSSACIFRVTPHPNPNEKKNRIKPNVDDPNLVDKQMGGNILDPEHEQREVPHIKCSLRQQHSSVALVGVSTPNTQIL